MQRECIYLEDRQDRKIRFAGHLLGGEIPHYKVMLKLVRNLRLVSSLDPVKGILLLDLDYARIQYGDLKQVAIDNKKLRGIRTIFTEGDLLENKDPSIGEFLGIIQYVGAFNRAKRPDYWPNLWGNPVGLKGPIWEKAYGLYKKACKEVEAETYRLHKKIEKRLKA